MAPQVQRNTIKENIEELTFTKFCFDSEELVGAFNRANNSLMKVESSLSIVIICKSNLKTDIK